MGLGCVKTFWAGADTSEHQLTNSGTDKLAMFLQLRAGIDCIACPAAVGDLVVVSRVWARRCPALTPGSPPLSEKPKQVMPRLSLRSSSRSFVKPVCTENLILFDYVTESPNVNGDDRAAQLLRARI